EQRVGERGVAVLEFGAERVGVLGQKVVLLLAAVRERDLPFQAEAGAERAAAVHHMEISVVERMGAGVPQLRRAPTRPWQTVIVAADFRNSLSRGRRKH